MKGISRNEKGMVRYRTLKGETYDITFNEINGYYFIYKIENNEANKLGKAKSPLDLEEKYIPERNDK